MSDQITKHDQVLLSLSLNLQTMAMVQLGKITNPATGEMERDLEAARGTIDILEMLKAKCRTDTPEPVLRMLDQAVMDLQMNYLDEIKKERRGGQAPKTPETPETPETPDAPADPGEEAAAAEETETEPRDPETDQPRDAGA